MGTSICEVLDCNKPAKARNLCSTHYSQLRRTGSPLGVKADAPPFTPTKPTLVCMVEGCENSHLCQGYCSMHYQRFRSTGNPLLVKERTPISNTENMGRLPESLVLCKACGIGEPYISPQGQRTRECKKCRNVARSAWGSKVGRRFMRYKLTQEDLDTLRKEQDYGCAICGDSLVGESKSLEHVDHDNSCCSHETVKNKGACGNCNRGLLCSSCNQGLGNFKDNPQRLTNAINYLRKWGIE